MPAATLVAMHSSTASYLGLPVVLTRTAAAATTAGPPAALYGTAVGAVLDAPLHGPASVQEHRVLDATGAPAATVRMGTVDVALSHHVAVAYGVAAGLLRAEPDGEPYAVDAVFGAPEEFRVAAHTAPVADRADAVEQRAIYGWYLGMPAVHHVELPAFYGGSAPAEPSPDRPDVRCYLTGPVDDHSPRSPLRQVPTADGIRNLTPHQNTTDVLPGATPHNTFGYFVVRGPDGTDADVRVRPSPPDPLPDQPLAHALLVGGRWLRLDNHLVVELGVRTGQLALLPFEFGGLTWTTFPDATQLTVTTAATGAAPPLPTGRLTAGPLDLRRAFDDNEVRENTPVAPGARRVEVRARSFAFDPPRLRARVGEDLAIVLHALDVPQNFKIDEFDGFVAADVGEPSTGGFRVDRAGEFEFYCSDASSRASGQVGILVVEET